MYKNSWEKDIEKDYNDRKASVVWALTDGNDIEKGIASDIMYSDSDLKYVSKKGSEIKEKIVDVKSSEAIKLAEANIKLSTLKKQIGVEPEGEEMEDTVDDRYKKRYSYKQMYPEKQLNNLTGEIEESVNTNSSSLMREYNNCIYKYNHCQKEIRTLDTITNGINEKKDYKLPIKVATDLGF